MFRILEDGKWTEEQKDLIKSYPPADIREQIYGISIRAFEATVILALFLVAFDVASLPFQYLASRGIWFVAAVELVVAVFFCGTSFLVALGVKDNDKTAQRAAITGVQFCRGDKFVEYLRLYDYGTIVMLVVSLVMAGYIFLPIFFLALFCLNKNSAFTCYRACKEAIVQYPFERANTATTEEAAVKLPVEKMQEETVVPQQLPEPQETKKEAETPPIQLDPSSGSTGWYPGC